MKKSIAVAVFSTALLLITMGGAKAQDKFGYFDLDRMVSIMPGVSGVDSLMAIYEKDSLGAEYNRNLSNWRRMDSAFKADSAKLLPKMRETQQQEMSQLVYLLQNWQQYSQQASQQKQQELLQPFSHESC